MNLKELFLTRRYARFILGIVALASAPLWIESLLTIVGLSSFSLIHPPFLTLPEILSTLVVKGYSQTILIPLVMGVLSTLSLGFWIFTYSLGFYLNRAWVRNYSSKKLAIDSLVMVSGIWVLGLIENLPSVPGIYQYYKKVEQWNITPK